MVTDKEDVQERNWLNNGKMQVVIMMMLVMMVMMVMVMIVMIVLMVMVVIKMMMNRGRAGSTTE